MDNEKINSTDPESNPSRASMGNASNPSAEDSAAPAGPEGLLDSRADKYIREVAPIEDLPDDEDQQDLEQVISEEGKD